MGNIDGFLVDYDENYNPTIKSPNSLYPLQFYQTRESFVDIDHYKKFIDNAVSRFRHSRTYKNYKSYIMSLGMDKCQLMPAISEELLMDDEDDKNHKNKRRKITLEMHHNFLTIWDIALMISEHILNTRGFISTFDLVHLLKEEHKNNRIPLVMLSKTAHQMFHNNKEFMIPANMCFGFWQELLMKYNKGITPEIANKVNMFIQRSLEVYNQNEDFTNNLLALRQNILGWSEWNQYGQQMQISGITYDMEEN